MKKISRFLLVFIIAITLASVMGCTTTKYVEVPKETTKTEYTNIVTYDSLYLHDSIFVLQKGDTVLKNKIQYVYKFKHIRDTVLKTDTLTQTKIKINTVEKKVEVNKLKVWQKVFMSIGAIALLGILLFITYLVGKYIKK